jgi:Fe-S oxidoreductase
LAAWGVGADRAAADAARDWQNAFVGQGFATVLTPCASCAAHLQKTQTAGPPVFEFFTWLAKQDLDLDLRGKRVAVHVPCHTRRGVRGGDAVTDVLRQAGAEIISLPPTLDEQCCGMGGTFGARHTELSRAIGRPKVAAMLAAEPDAIVSGCTGCLLQLRDLVREAGADVPVLSPVALLRG